MEGMFPKFSPDEARKLAHEGGTILCWNVPPSTRFGIDGASFETGEKFKGVKMVPCGAHFISTSARLKKSHGSVGDEKRVSFAPDTKSDTTAAEDGDLEMKGDEEEDHDCDEDAHVGSVDAGEISSSEVKFFGEPKFESPMGFWVYLNARQVVVFEWSTRFQCLIPFQDRAQAERLSLAVKRMEFDAALGPYPLKIYPRWHAISHLIDERCIFDMNPIFDSDGDDAATEITMPRSGEEKMTMMCGDDALISMTSAVSESEGEKSEIEIERKRASDYEKSKAMLRKFDRYYYTKIPSIAELKSRAGGSDAEALSPAKISALGMDKSAILFDVMKIHKREALMRLLAEMQHAFASFSLGANLQALEHWKSCVDLFAHAFELYESEMEFYVEFIEVLTRQLAQLPDDFFSDELTKYNFLNRSLLNIFEMSNEAEIVSVATERSKSAVVRLHTLCRKKFAKVFPRLGSVTVLR